MTEVAVAHMPVIPSMKGLQRNLTNAMAPAAAKASDQVGQTMGARMSSRLSFLFNAAILVSLVATPSAALGQEDDAPCAPGSYSFTGVGPCYPCAPGSYSDRTIPNELGTIP